MLCRSAWLQMREGRLTGSILPNMLSWFGGTERDDMLRLWREKLGLQERPPRKQHVVGAADKHSTAPDMHVTRHGKQDLGENLSR
jgi:hypothetical protein